jgi:hypothetical protein
MMNVPRRRLLATPLKMYIVTASSDDTNDAQGTLIYASDSANASTEVIVCAVDVHYTCEFLVPVDGSITMAKPLPEDPDSKEETDQQMVVVEARWPPLKPPAARRA